MFAMKLKIAIANECAWQKSGFSKDLESVADPEHEAAVFGKLLNRLHHGAEPCDSTAAQVIAVAESAGHDHAICVAERSFFVPHVTRGMADCAHGMNGVLVAIGCGELKDDEIHFIYEFQFTSANRERLGSFDLQFVIFNDRVAQKFVRGIVQRALRGGFVGSGCEIDLNVFADVNAGDALITHVFKRVLHGFALRIQHRFLRCNDDFGFHF